MMMMLMMRMSLPPCAAPADAVNNAAGYGFSGMDGNGKASWDLISNLNILGIEVTGPDLLLPWLLDSNRADI